MRRLPLGRALLAGGLWLALTLGIVSIATSSQAVPLPASMLNVELLLNGTPEFVESTASTSPTAATINVTAGRLIRIQCDAATYIYVPGTATASNGEKVAADARYQVFVPTNDTDVSILAVSGTVNCKRWNMR